MTFHSSICMEPDVCIAVFKHINRMGVVMIDVLFKKTHCLISAND